jgi:hypothetical protein
MPTLLFQITEANLEKDNNLFLDMNPRYVVEYNGNIVIEGPKAFGMGKDPIWNDFSTVNHVV